MSKISKALDKYKKEHNLSSAQIFNLDDAKATESALKEGEDRSIRKGVNAAADKQPAHLYPQQEESIYSPAADSREASQQQADSPSSEPKNIEPKRSHRFVLVDRQPEKTASTDIENKGRAPLLGDEKTKPATQPPELTSAAPSEPNCACTPSKRYAPDLISVFDPHCVEAKMFKELQAKILFPKLGKPPKSILVTSAAAGEGKSFVASNLAINLAHDFENHVLLVDCDLRRPTLNELFGFGVVKGLSEHLTNGNELTELLLKTGLGKLSLLASGKPPANPSELLSSEKMANLIEELKNRYDDRFLVIDSPPPNIAPETAAIAKLVYAIIVVIDYGSTPIHLIEEMLDNLGREKIIGAVVNRYDSQKSVGKTYRKRINNFNSTIINAWKALKNSYNQRF